MTWAVAVFGGFWLFGALEWPHNGQQLSQHSMVQAIIGASLIVVAVIAHVLEHR